MAKKSLYPPSPLDVPDDLVHPSSNYKTQVFLVLLSLFLFFVLYFGLLFGSAFLVYKCLTVPVRANNEPVWFILRILGIPFGILMFLFLLKGFFKFERAEKTFDVEIFEEDHPQLWDFVERLCEETNAPFPARIFVNYQVNAYASYNKSLFHLFFPTRKNLTLGLGLINVLNLTEFKAVLAHEFGHFSQKSMKIGGYVYTASDIIDDLVYGRDWFDRFLDAWCCLDIRISFPAWGFKGILWGLRHLLGGLLYAITFLHFGLKRQMEFNADLVAVSVTGSDAPVHTLCRCMLGDVCLEHAINDVAVAMDHHLYTRDLFYHQTKAIPVVRREMKDPNFGEPPPLPANPRKTTQVFEPDDDHLALMWSTHPSNFDREENAKDYYIRTEFDERSPWLLFDNVEELKERVTYKFYRFHFKVPKDVILAEPEEVQGFIDEERAEVTYDPRYQGLYDCRNVQLTKIDELTAEAKANPWTINQLAHTHANLYNVEVKHRAQLHNKRLEEARMLHAIRQGWHRPKNDEIDFRGEFYDVEDAKKLLKKVEKEIAADQEWLEQLDKKVFLCYYQMALHADPRLAKELVSRYRFHIELQDIWGKLQSQREPVDAAVAFLNNTQQMDYAHFQEALAIFRDAHHAMRESLRLARDMTVPALKNVVAGEPLAPLLLKGKLVHGLSEYETQLKATWINKLLDQFREMMAKVNRIHFKSLGGILALQEKVGQMCLDKWNALPQATTAGN